MDAAYVYRADVLDVHDGDTYKLRVDLGFRCAVTIQCRLRGVNAPELNTPEGKVAQQFVQKLLKPTPYPEENGQVVVESYRDQQSFARWVCDVWLGDGRSLADVLVEAGYAVRWP
jgi:micrococcal nuclease